MPDSQEIILTTCPRDCFDTCGIAVVKRNGVIAHVRGDPSHPVSRGKLCAKCSISYNREWRNPQARLTRPLRRVGPKGEGRFEPVSWDAALAAIADRFTADRDDHRAADHYQHPLHGHYLAPRLLLSAALFPPPRRDGGHPRHDLPHGGRRGAQLCLWHGPGWL